MLNKTIYPKNVPKTTKKNYLSGWQSLNLQLDKENWGGDWHFINHFYSFNQNQELPTYSYNSHLGFKGILKRTIKIFDTEKTIYVASYPRVVFDLWHRFLKTNQFDMLYEFSFSNKQKNIIHSYLKICNCHKCKEYLEIWN
ncbi:hypothetical protein [Mycoplasmopsis iners]|uniref:hypothetical protein n=1 Tax=Mycoplasmopsis iners TaxID=76630 RepID=UPI0004952C23|nr:hypothetical protein [Mycoplasmopsis iners]